MVRFNAKKPENTLDNLPPTTCFLPKHRFLPKGGTFVFRHAHPQKTNPTESKLLALFIDYLYV
jgi:hypothetical protein